ncbi:hypothetical protein XENORESO_011315 [Xenotaenia resolanae]|uniref:Uncharacterized protein n=1 Tax=Xenotaenia resolanae TaxID=208358 RepID=A0ABV0X692_9TELE
METAFKKSKNVIEITSKNNTGVTPGMYQHPNTGNLYNLSSHAHSLGTKIAPLSTSLKKYTTFFESFWHATIHRILQKTEAEKSSNSYCRYYPADCVSGKLSSEIYLLFSPNP